MRRLRSMLFVPCANERAMTKARDIPCDALVFDLEDAVGDAEREAALGGLASALAASVGAPFAARRVLVRIHPPSLNAIHKTLNGLPIDGLVVPKVDDAEALRAVAHIWPGMALWAMIETARGVIALPDIAGAGALLSGLIAGANDLRKDLRSRAMEGRADIVHALSSVVLYARAHGLVAIDSVYNAYRDETGFAVECRQGRSLGFDGKSLIHPDQVAVANRAFSPADDEIAWAKAVIAGFDGSDAGVIALGGEMIERMHLAQARDILAASSD